VGAGGDLRMVNGSCLWSDESAAPGIITSGACTQPQGGWKWAGTAAKGDVTHTASSKCLTESLTLGACGTGVWTQQPSGSTNTSHVYLSAGGAQGGCIVGVPDNNNNTLGVALAVADATGSLMKGQTAPVDKTDPSAGMHPPFLPAHC